MGQKSILISEPVLLVRPWLTGCGIEDLKAVLVERAARFRKGGYMIDFGELDLMSPSE
jgi:hypothetical protein